MSGEESKSGNNGWGVIPMAKTADDTFNPIRDIVDRIAKPKEFINLSLGTFSTFLFVVFIPSIFPFPALCAPICHSGCTHTRACFNARGMLLRVESVTWIVLWLCKGDPTGHKNLAPPSIFLDAVKEAVE